MRKTIFLLTIAFMLVGLPVYLIVPEAEATSWGQTSTTSFDDGDSFMVDISGNTITLSQSLAGTWRVSGEAEDDWFGESVDSAGDVNGDGYDDVIVGAYLNDDSASGAGEAYVFYGSDSGLSTTPDWSARGEAASDFFGYTVAGAGDVNGDGYDDVLVGAYGNDDAGNYAGEAYVYHGSALGLSSSSDWSDQGEAEGDYFGKSLSAAGDITGDGYDDIIIAASGNNNGAGEAYVYFGSSSGLTQDADPDWVKAGEKSGDYFGSSVSCAGDINADGYGELVIGAYGNDDGGNLAGEAYVYFGTSQGISSTPGWYYQGENANDNFGLSADGAGDVNGDGYADVIVCAPYNDDGPGDTAGKAYLFHGSSSGLAASPAWSDLGEADDDRFGYAVSAAGDVNGDGFGDVVLGAYYNNDVAIHSGKAYLYLGTSSGLLPEPSWSGRGEETNAYFAHRLAGAGDVNGDGYADVIIGAEGSDLGADNAGAAYLFSYGSSAALPSWYSWSDTGSADYDYYGNSVSSAGDVNGDGYADIIVGITRDDDAGEDAGAAKVYHGSATGPSTSADWSDLGETSLDRYGVSVSGAGDVNGDGYDDVIVGAWLAGTSNAGKAYAYYGSSTGLSSTPDWSVEGSDQNDWLGANVAGAGDVNGDGYDDVLVGVYGNDSVLNAEGKALVYFGSSTGLSTTSDWSDNGEAQNDNFGVRVAAAGDVNGDGYDDILVGTYKNDSVGTDSGKAYLYFGSGKGPSTDPDWTDTGEAADDQYAYSLAGAGDVNGDGYDDIIIGARWNDDGPGTSAGKAYVHHGSSTGPSTNPSWTKIGALAGDALGYQVSGTGDLNGDGYSDVLVSAIGRDVNGSGDGMVYAYHGSSSGLSDTPDWARGGEGDYDSFGNALSPAGDVNGDGYDDVLIGTHENDTGFSDAGKAYVYLSSGSAKYGVYESKVFNSQTSNGVDWQSLSWSPTLPQPAGTSVKVQLGTSDDGSSWDWQGPSGTSSSYYTGAAGQAIYSGDRGRQLKLRFILENDFGTPGDGLGVGDSARTPTIESFAIEYSQFMRPSVELNWPNGGENLMHGETYAVTWSASGDLQTSNPVKLEYSLNAGSSWTTINSGTENDGTYLWTLPSNQDVERALVRVTVTGVDGSTVQDTSDASFSIDPPPVDPTTKDRILSPTLGDGIRAGEEVTLRWQLQGEEKVSIHYTEDFGQSWMPVVQDIENFGIYSWKLPDELVSEHVVLRVSTENEKLDSAIFTVSESSPEESTAEEGDIQDQGPGPVTVTLATLVLAVLLALALVVRYDSGKKGKSER